MIRKQLYIPPEMDRELEIAARKEGKREAQLIREFLAAGLKMETPIENAGTFLLDLAAIGARGPKDLSTNMFLSFLRFGLLFHFYLVLFNHFVQSFKYKNLMNYLSHNLKHKYLNKERLKII